MKKRYKIIYKKSECIGAGACEFAFPEGWFYDKDTSIATLKDPATEKTDEKETLIISEELFEKHLEAAPVCPVGIIEIFDMDTGERVWPK